MYPALVAASMVVGVAGCPSLASTVPIGCTNATTLTVGDTVRTSFGVNSCKDPTNGTFVDFYNLRVTSQANLVLSLSSPGLATYVMVYDANRMQVVNSVFEKAPDSSATVRVMLDSAFYQIAVRDTLGMQGAYRFSVTLDTAPVAGCGLIWVTRGITTTQQLTNSDCVAGSGSATRYYHRYEMVMLFAQTATFTDSSTAFSPAMTLTGLLGSTTNSTLDGTGTVATLAGFAQAADFYQLSVSTSAALQTGAYTMKVK